MPQQKGIPMKRKKRNNIITELLVILAGIIFIAPILLVLVNSFKSYGEIYTSPFALPTEWRADNYVKVFNNMQYFTKFRNSVITTLMPLPFILVVGSMAAYKMVRTKTKLATILFYIMVSTMLIPISVIMVPLMTQMAQFRLTDSLVGIVLIYIGFQTPFTVFLYHGFIKNISLSIEESARIDGCNSLQTFFRIVFPMLKPITATITVLLSLNFWNDFFLPMLMIRSNARRTLPLEAFRYIGEAMKDWPMLLPAAILLSLPIFVFFFVFQRYILDGIGQGAVKG